MKLKQLHEDVELWATKAINEINDLINTETKELNPLALSRVLSIVTGLSAGIVVQKLKEIHKTSIEEQIKYFYENI